MKAHRCILAFLLAASSHLLPVEFLIAQDSTSLIRSSPSQSFSDHARDSIPQIVSQTVSQTISQTVFQTVPQNIGQIIERDFLYALTDAGLYYTQPLRFTAVDWAVSAGVIAGTVALFSADESLRRAIRQPSVQTPLSDSFAGIGRLYGETLMGASIGAVLYASGLAAQNEDVRSTGRLLIEALAFGGALNLTMKAGFGRSRPYLNEGASAYNPLQSVTQRTALPSGHATVAFAVSTVLSERIGNPYVSVVLYALAGLTGLSRMYQDLHWASDVFLGAAIGTGAGLAVTQFERERAKQGSETQSLRVYPTLNGVGLTYIFR
jgi:membrane-associated phospholipid phosphatase